MGGLSSGVRVTELGSMRRKARRPQHTFYLKQIPFQIQPFMIAPVLPGETLKNLLLQARCVTDPVKNPIIGWWLEYYFFYIKHRDLSNTTWRDTFTNMMIDPSTTTAALKDSSDQTNVYFNPGTDNQLNIVLKCLETVTQWYFRTQDEAWNNYTLNGLPMASVVGNSWLDSFINDDAFQTSIEPTIDTSGASVGITVIEQAMRQWEMLKNDNLIDMTYEDYLRTYGVNLQTEVPHKPELIRFVRNWQYPSNTINATTGAPTSAVSWAVAERADKDRFFKEPGYIFGVSVIRPKIYFNTQVTYGAAFLDDPYSWLPAIMSDDPNTSLKQFTAGTGPLQTNTDDYWIDMKDLFLFGDQFTNQTIANPSWNGLTLPDANGNKKYPTSQAMIDTLFVSANATCKVDGIVSLNISGRLENTT